MNPLLFALLLLSFTSSFGQRKSKIGINAYVFTGINYGSKCSPIVNPNITLKTKGTPNIGIGTQLQKKRKFVDLQLGIATVNNYLINTTPSTILTKEQAGNTTKKLNYFDIKLTLNQIINITKNDRSNVYLIIGAGVRYALSRNEIVDEKENDSVPFTELFIWNANSINLDPVNGQHEKRVNLFALHQYTALRYATSKIPILFELFWNPSITQIRNGRYTINNYSPTPTIGYGNHKQMLSSAGVKFIYKLK